MATVHNPCVRCGTRCDAYEHCALDERDAIISFCTWACAEAWHRVTGRPVVRLATLELTHREERPLYQIEEEAYALRALACNVFGQSQD